MSAKTKAAMSVSPRDAHEDRLRRATDRALSAATTAPLKVRAVLGLLEDVRPLPQYADQERRPANRGRLYYAARLANLSEGEWAALLDIAQSAQLTDRHAAHLVRRLER